MLNFHHHADFEAFCQQYADEQTCIDALFAARWPGGFQCPACGSHLYSTIRTRRLPLFECRDCRRQTSLISGTIMEGSRTSLVRWFQAMYLLAQPAGISAARLEEILDVTYKTAWLIAHKIRRAIQAAEDGSRLDGDVIVKSFHYGYPFLIDARQPLLLGAELQEEHTPARIMIKQPAPEHVNPANRRIRPAGMEAFIHHQIAASRSTVMNRPVRDNIALYEIQSCVCSWLNVTFCGIGPKHLQAYLDEFCYRWNRRFIAIGHVFERIMAGCATTRRTTYRELIRPRNTLPVPWIVWGSKAKWKGYHLRMIEA